MTAHHQQTDSAKSKVQPPFSQVQESDPQGQSKIGTEGFGHPRRVEWIRYGNQIAQITKDLQVLAQQTASRRVHKIESDAKRAFERLANRAETEVRGFLAHARQPTKEKWIRFGAELVKLGEKLQTIASPPIAGTAEKAPAVKSADVAASATLRGSRTASIPCARL